MKAIIHEDKDSRFEFITDPPDWEKFTEELHKALFTPIHLPDTDRNERIESKARRLDYEKYLPIHIEPVKPEEPILKFQRRFPEGQ